MEPTRADTPEALPIDPVDIITRMLFHGLLENIGELVENGPMKLHSLKNWAMTSSWCMIKVQCFEFFKYREDIMNNLGNFV